MIVRARGNMFSLVLNRHAVILGGEALLFINIIRQAYDDVVEGKKNRLKFNREAVNFFFDGRMDNYADLVGLDPDFVREMLLRGVPGLKKFTPQSEVLAEAVGD